MGRGHGLDRSRGDRPQRGTALRQGRRPVPGDDSEAEAARRRALGATAIDLDQSVRWRVMADPEGNEFCLLAPGWPQPSLAARYGHQPRTTRRA
ncbi:VOC family protein [Micromonospora echinaurantiaca]|uniref:VOC family protein n=1 Tax=Micromonospora echinaurantiaca TaxID=47857 RepID=UPI003712F9AD